MRNKRASYITKNNEIIQEFYFAHPKTKIEINEIYNSHFTGSPLWDLFCRDSDMMFNTWNKSVRLMSDVSIRTHRYFLESLAGKRHLKIILMKRFLNFVQQIEKSSKVLPKHLLQTIRNDARSTTGSNLRNILLLTRKYDNMKLAPSDALGIKYEPILDENKWKIDMTMELIDAKWGRADIENLSTAEIDEVLEYICTS